MYSAHVIVWRRLNDLCGDSGLQESLKKKRNWRAKRVVRTCEVLLKCSCTQISFYPFLEFWFTFWLCSHRQVGQNLIIYLYKQKVLWFPWQNPRCYIDANFPEIFLFPLVSAPTIRQYRRSWIRASVLPGADGLVGTVEPLPTSLETKTGSQLQI